MKERSRGERQRGKLQSTVSGAGKGKHTVSGDGSVRGERGWLDLRGCVRCMPVARCCGPAQLPTEALTPEQELLFLFRFLKMDLSPCVTKRLCAWSILHAQEAPGCLSDSSWVVLV